MIHWVHGMETNLCFTRHILDSTFIGPHERCCDRVALCCRRMRSESDGLFALPVFTVVWMDLEQHFASNLSSSVAPHVSQSILRSNA